MFLIKLYIILNGEETEYSKLLVKRDAVNEIIYDRIEINDFFVTEEERQKGIGKKLMSYLVCIAINNHVINITLEVRISNEVWL